MGGTTENNLTKSKKDCISYSLFVIRYSLFVIFNSDNHNSASNIHN